MRDVATAARGIVCLGLSLAVHVVVLGLLVKFGADAPEPAPQSTEKPTPAPSAETQPSAEVQPASQSEKKPVVEETVTPPPPVDAEPVAEKEPPPEDDPKPVIEARVKKQPAAAAVKPKTEPAKERPKVVREKQSKPDDKEASDVPAVYVVKRGDTLTKVAREAGVSPARLAEINGVTVRKLSNIKVGQKIRLKPKE